MRRADVAVDESGFDAMGIEELVALGQEAGLREIEELDCRGDGAVLRVTVASRYDEDRLSELECVDDWERAAETEDGHVYVVAFTAPELPERLAERVEDLIGTCDPEFDGGDATMSLVGSQESISGAIEAYEAAGVSTHLRRLASYDGSERPLDELTDRQREVLETAFEAGYFEVPRQASTEEVAAELELDPSTVTEHLQRAQRNLLDRLLG